MLRLSSLNVLFCPTIRQKHKDVRFTVVEKREKEGNPHILKKIETVKFCHFCF